MNGLGRHYRDPADPQNPTCNYEHNGAKCTFFEDNPDLASIPYPEDVGLGPAIENQSQPTAPQAIDMAAIVELLRQQKEDNDKQLRELQDNHTRQIGILQQQMNALASPPVTASLVTASSIAPGTSSITTVAVTSSLPTVTPSYGLRPTTLPSAAPTPQLVANAANAAG